MCTGLRYLRWKGWFSRLHIGLLDDVGNFWLGPCETICIPIGSPQDYWLLSNPSLTGPDWATEIIRHISSCQLDCSEIIGNSWACFLSLLISSSWSGHSATSTRCYEVIGGFGMGGLLNMATMRYLQFFHHLWAHSSHPWMLFLLWIFFGIHTRISRYSNTSINAHGIVLSIGICWCPMNKHSSINPATQHFRNETRHLWTWGWEIWGGGKCARD